MVEPHRTDCAYLAGLIDADGNIGLDKFGGQRVPSVRMQLTNTNLRLLEDMQEIWGGRIYQNRPVNEKWKDSFYLRWSGAKAARNVLPQILPYLRIKASQADLALLFAETVNVGEHRTRRLTPSVLAIRAEVGNALSLLNKRGTS